MKVIAIIPARLRSERLPKKVLCDIGGQSLIERVYNKAIFSALFEEVIVATDDEEVLRHCDEKGIKAAITSNEHKSGTDRVAEVARMSNADIVINIQGDEPFIETSVLRSLVDLMKRPNVSIGTVKKPIKSIDNLFDFNIVKVVSDSNDQALYFSRQAIPSQRNLPFRKWMDNATYYQHLGIYGFKKETLEELSQLKQHRLELSERLEQLRWIGNGYSIHVSKVESSSFGIDTPEDLEKARAFALSL